MKKKKSGGGANWMDTYGDMVTLLLCFFVLLYSMSTLDSKKWEAIVMSFNPLAVQTPTQNPDGTGGMFHDPDMGDMNPGILEIPDENLTAEQKETVDQLNAVLQSLTALSQKEGMSQSVNVSATNGRIFVTFNQTTFFAGESWTLRESSLPILDEVAAVLNEHRDYLDMVQIIGHTAQARPDQPNEETSDRRISSLRATEVAIYIQMNTDIDPARIVPVGRGQWAPVADNQDEEGRAQNRRVEMIISGKGLEDVLKDYILSYGT